MNKKIIPMAFVMFLFTAMLGPSLTSVKAEETIYISSDFTFTEDLYEPIVVTADNIVIDGNGYTLQGPGNGYGFNLNTRIGVTIKNVVVKGWHGGIGLFSSNYNTLSDNIISNNHIGIGLDTSQGNTLSGNSLYYNDWYGITLVGSHGNTLTGNTASNCYYGIFLDGSSCSTLTNNVMVANTYNFGCWSGGHLQLLYNQHIDTSNTVDGKPIYYWINQENKQIPANAGYVAIVGSRNITLRDLTITNNHEGIQLVDTVDSRILNTSVLQNRYGMYSGRSGDCILSNNTFSYNHRYAIYLENSGGTTLTDNTFSYNRFIGFHTLFSDSCTLTGNTFSYNGINGILLQHSDGCTLIGNNVSNSDYAHYSAGIYLYYSSDNTLSHNSVSSNSIGILLHGSLHSANNLIYHNNIVNNIIAQARDDEPLNNNWHDPDLLEGNYWSDYPGADDGSGTGKHAIAGDGIGDTDISWPGPDYDYYPLMNPWTPIISVTIEIEPETLNLKSNGEFVNAYIEMPEGYNVADIDLSTVQLEDILSITDTKYSFVIDPNEYLVDHDGDTILERLIKFDRATVISYLNAVDLISETGKFKEVILKITGKVGEVTFEGSDKLKVII